MEFIWRVKCTGDVNDVHYFDNRVEAELRLDTYEKKCAADGVPYRISLSPIPVPKTARDFASFMNESTNDQ